MRSRPASRATSAQPRTSHLPPPVPSKRWSSGLECLHRTRTPSVAPEFIPTVTRSRTPSYPSYSDALIKSSQRLRERSMTPVRLPPVTETPSSSHKSNMDYYRGKVKSIYEKEPAFKDFARNIPLSETNLYDTNNISRLKRRFNTMISEKCGGALKANPFSPSPVGVSNIGVYQPQSDALSRKHKGRPPPPRPLPCIYVYHRNTRHV